MPVSNNDRQWQRAWRYIRANQAAPAQAALESILTRDPQDARAQLYLGSVHASQDRPRAAARHINAAAAIAPEDAELLLEIARAAVRAGEIARACDLLRHPAIRDGTSSALLLSAGVLWQLIGDHEAAFASIEQARRLGAKGRSFHFYRATQLGFKGDRIAAETEFERCLAFDAPLGHVYLQLALLRKQTATRNHLGAIKAALARVDPAGEDAVALQFARYKELEDLGRHADAWRALECGNARVHAHASQDPAGERKLFDRLIDVCTREFLERSVDRDDDGPQPIFVIGMPRSGTTLLERILGNHSQVQAAGEFAAFTQALTFAIDHQVPLAMPDALTLERIPDTDWSEVARHYLAQSRWRARGKPFYVDKLPRNWMLAGLIHKALPRAPILNLLRDPMDVCFSNWRAHLGVGPEYAYAYDLEALATRHGEYRRVSAHWHVAMPGAVLDVDYARLVREPDVVARDVFEFCGLAYEPGCTDISRNKAPSATLSSAQIREPIHARSLRAWLPYATQLAALATALGAAPGSHQDIDGGSA